MSEDQVYETEKAKAFILDRLSKRPDITELITFGMTEAINHVIDVDENFLEKALQEDLNYDSEDEVEYIREKTGLAIEFIDWVLWQKCCYEMELGLWEDVSNTCLNCGGSKLLIKEVIGEDFTDKIVCQDCGYEMTEGEIGLEKFEAEEEE